MKKVKRGVEVFEKATEFYIGTYPIPIELADIKLLVEPKEDDPLYYYGYDITPELAQKLKKYTDFNFDFNNYEYFLVAWADEGPQKPIVVDRIERIKVDVWRQTEQKKKKKGKRDKSVELKLNLSLGIFKLNDSIENYLDSHHKIISPTLHTEYERYEFADYKDVEVWVREGKIDTIRTEKDCFYYSENMIGMDFEVFMRKYRPKVQYSHKTSFPISENYITIQTIYELKKMGLILWVWRKKIRTVLVYNSLVYQDRGS